MTDAEISRRLALAIGWQEKQNDPDVILELDWRDDTAQCKVWFDEKWRTFDYRDPAVIWPIAERFAAFPMRSAKGTGWVAITEDLWHSGSNYDFANADTAAKAVALAVIKAHEGAIGRRSEKTCP